MDLDKLPVLFQLCKKYHAWLNNYSYPAVTGIFGLSSLFSFVETVHLKLLFNTTRFFLTYQR